MFTKMALSIVLFFVLVSSSSAQVFERGQYLRPWNGKGLRVNVGVGRIIHVGVDRGEYLNSNLQGTHRHEAVMFILRNGLTKRQKRILIKRMTR